MPVPGKTKKQILRHRYERFLISRFDLLYDVLLGINNLFTIAGSKQSFKLTLLKLYLLPSIGST